MKLNQPVTLRLLRDQPHVGQSSHGPYFLYSVQDEQRQEYAWFAPVDVHEAIQTSGLKSGSEISVKRVKGGRVELSVLGKSETSEQKPDTLREQMMQSVHDADFILKNCGVQVSEELQKLSTAIFIARTKAN